MTSSEGLSSLTVRLHSSTEDPSSQMVRLQPSIGDRSSQTAHLQPSTEDPSSGSLRLQRSRPNSTGRSFETMVVSPETRGLWVKFNPHRQFYVLKTVFVLLCLFNTIYWAYMLRDDNETSPNVWKFYVKINEYDQYYLLLRMFADIFVCILGLGATMWTMKIALTIPCLLVQSMLICARGLIWILRGSLPDDHRTEDIVFIAFEFVLPFIWAAFSVAVMRTIRSISKYDRIHGSMHPPLIVLTVKNDNDESVQIEISP